MALLDSEGFGLSTNINDYLTYSAFRQEGSQLGSIMTGGPLGDNYLTFTNAQVFRRLIPSMPASMIVGFRGALSSTSSTYLYFRDASANVICYVQFTDTGQVQIYGFNNSTYAATQAATSVPGAVTGTSGPPLSWEYIEVSCAISGTTATVVARVNGATVLTASSFSTAQGATPAVSFIDWGLYSGTYTGPWGLMHIYISDTTGPAPWNTFLGDVRVQSIYPTANASVQFTPVGQSANWQNGAMLVPVPATDYNSSSTVGQQDTFVMQPMASTLGQVYGVHVKPLVYKSDSGQRMASSVMVSGGTTAVGTSTALALTATQVKTMYQTDPHTSAQWTQAAVNAINAGYQVTG